ncbi:MAG TPA: hypothetical protein VEU08_01890 [Vicinamibacterales bacterium]|nr:hypothetical protein [Vicinamibacterales bacterium]
MTFVSLALLAGLTLWRFRAGLFRSDSVRVTIGLDRWTPGAHLIWDIANASAAPVTLTRLVMHGRRGSANNVPLGLPKVLEPQDRIRLAIDVDWTVIGAQSVAAVDAAGAEHRADPRQLASVQQHLRELVDRRAAVSSAREFLFGATDLVFGVAILGLGVFMLMWMIATG